MKKNVEKNNKKIKNLIIINQHLVKRLIYKKFL